MKEKLYKLYILHIIRYLPPPPPSPQYLKLLGLILYFILIMPLNDRIVKYVYNTVESL